MRKQTEKHGLEKKAITRIGVIGSGTMGIRIAYRCLVNNITCHLFDISETVLSLARKNIRDFLEDDIKNGIIDSATADQAMEQLHIFSKLDQCLDGVQLVIETVPENLELKKKVFGELDRLASGEVILATNSSSIPCSRIAVATNRADKVINYNFSDPVENPLVEIMKGKDTSNETLVASVAFMKSLGMVPIVTRREIMGFSYNRIWRAIKREALFLVDQGYASHEDIDRAWMLDYGQPIGPFGIMDAIGLDVVRDIENQYFLESGEERDRPPGLLDDMISSGNLGMKSGSGFYSYPEPAYESKEWLMKTENRTDAAFES